MNRTSRCKRLGSKRKKMMTKEEVKKKIENILNRYYKETEKEIISPIFVYKVLNKIYSSQALVAENASPIAGKGPSSNTNVPLES